MVQKSKAGSHPIQNALDLTAVKNARLQVEHCVLNLAERLGCAFQLGRINAVTDVAQSKEELLGANLAFLHVFHELSRGLTEGRSNLLADASKVFSKLARQFFGHQFAL